MPFLLTLIAIVGGIGAWWWRAKNAAEAGGKAIDHAQRLRGRVRRKRARAAASFAPVSAIDDPVVAAATLMRFVAGDEGWPTARHEARRALGEIADDERIEEAITYAEWAAKQVEHEGRSIDELGHKLRDWLDAPERARMLAMLREVAGDDPDGHARLHRAGTALGEG